MVNAANMDGPLEPMSIEQWAALPANEPGEIVDGYLVEDEVPENVHELVVEEEVPENVHELVVAWFIGVFRGWGSAIGAIVLGSGAKYAVAQTRGRMPDVSMFLPGNPRPPRRGSIVTLRASSSKWFRKPHEMHGEIA